MSKDLADFDREMAGLYDLKPPITASKMQAITRSALKNVKLYKNVVHAVEKFIQRCSPELKLIGVYVVDALARAAQKIPDGEVFVGRFEEKLENMSNHLQYAPDRDKIKIRRTFGLWKKSQLFNAEMLANIEVAYLGGSDQDSHPSTGDASPPATVDTATATATATATLGIGSSDPRVKSGAVAPSSTLESLLPPSLAAPSLSLSEPPSTIANSDPSALLQALTPHLSGLGGALGLASLVPPALTSTTLPATPLMPTPMDALDPISSKMPPGSLSSLLGLAPPPPVVSAPLLPGLGLASLLTQSVLEPTAAALSSIPPALNALTAPVVSGGIAPLATIPGFPAMPLIDALQAAQGPAPPKQDFQRTDSPGFNVHPGLGNLDSGGSSQALFGTAWPSSPHDLPQRPADPRQSHANSLPARGPPKRGGNGDVYDYSAGGKRFFDDDYGDPNLPKCMPPRLDPALGNEFFKVLSRTVYVGGVTNMVTKEMLRDLFETVGRVDTVVVNYHKFNAFIKMFTRVECEMAREKLDHISVAGATLKLGWGCGFGPKNIFSYDKGETVFPMNRVVDPDRKWLVLSKRGPGRIQAGIVIEEPDVGVNCEDLITAGEPSPHAGMPTATIQRIAREYIPGANRDLDGGPHKRHKSSDGGSGDGRSSNSPGGPRSWGRSAADDQRGPRNPGGRGERVDNPPGPRSRSSRAGSSFSKGRRLDDHGDDEIAALSDGHSPQPSDWSGRDSFGPQSQHHGGLGRHIEAYQSPSGSSPQRGAGPYQSPLHSGSMSGPGEASPYIASPGLSHIPDHAAAIMLNHSSLHGGLHGSPLDSVSEGAAAAAVTSGSTQKRKSSRWNA
ncbi:uncharacterized protein BJ171DRAFT_509354 [Polychytrium aggregatum]|uniref:uncharacterized protein n=1 Tax=Polychytrium aggregatum TaxID=110093 RepID=UPI0022FE8F81|nr:uncharacterized protein BJ171DRAFT_509354 [Polychytrium aggregatum]KAI9203694.1 hypothetical protein BJ171DRAFT_509354 [Polychytrium aggregatum]